MLRKSIQIFSTIKYKCSRANAAALKTPSASIEGIEGAASVLPLPQCWVRDGE